MATDESYAELKPFKPKSVTSNPQTPQRSLSSTFSLSPSTTLRSDEEYLVFELGSRFLRAGFAGESSPRCVIGFGLEEQRRVGDYRRWQPDFQGTGRKRRHGETWGQHHELWRMDLSDLDLQLVGDKIERAIREAYAKYLLTDYKPRRAVLVLPSVMPHALLSTVLLTMFSNFQIPSMTLVSGPVLSTLAAGLRSALVIDIGWAETIVTAVFEYREVLQRQTQRGVRLASEAMGELLSTEAKGTSIEASQSQRLNQQIGVSFEETEEVFCRMAWCRSSVDTQAPETDDPIVNIPLKSTEPPVKLGLKFSRLGEPVETACFASHQKLQDLDDHELPIHQLAYNTLLSLPIDVRGTCMSRIVLTGGGSKIPGIKRRILDEINLLVQKGGWDPVKGQAAEIRKKKFENLTQEKATQVSMDNKVELGEKAEMPSDQTVPAANSEQTSDPITEKLVREESKHAKPYIQGVVRGVETLGPWAGGSLMASLKARGTVDVEKEKFLQQGLAGASKEGDIKGNFQRMSLGAATPRAGGAERSGWTLGLWA
ncbi:actin-like ATPase domain-containing protein [Xylona heveae TC161]|uniref:Actin-like ATPase domain-containing protein n=1 Tax=Xylona heveae (strain CBS 132557 / TC161) TaxID=1328760 RepID=A0A165IR72_XYLHT|nr:actin-like ATPase domain-containing protein [Xylona heveae TC161]KZF25266.1 actin-like ATPase domain-containing protein [Xylona heveae TC161]